MWCRTGSRDFGSRIDVNGSLVPAKSKKPPIAQRLFELDRATSYSPTHSRVQYIVAARLNGTSRRASRERPRRKPAGLRSAEFRHAKQKASDFSEAF